MTNCINCGAILTSNKCEYCGTEYKTDKKNNVNIEGNVVDDFIVNLTINGLTSKFYIAETITTQPDIDVFRDSNEKLMRSIKPHKSRKLTLIEY